MPSNPQKKPLTTTHIVVGAGVAIVILILLAVLVGTKDQATTDIQRKVDANLGYHMDVGHCTKESFPDVDRYECDEYGVLEVDRQTGEIVMSDDYIRVNNGN